MCTCTNILSQTDTPQLSAVELITIEIHFTGISSKRIIPGVGRIPFHNDFVFTITIDIAHAAIVRFVTVMFPFGTFLDASSVHSPEGRSYSIGRTIEMYAQKRLLPTRHRRRMFDLLSPTKRLYDILRSHASAGIEIVRQNDRL